MTDSKSDLVPTPKARPLLDAVHSPLDLKALSPEQLPQLCDEIRDFLLESVQTTGGHLGSNLGVVELSVALHRVFDLRRDRCVWDVSHQAYVHKILTGRRPGFAQLRRTGGLCGFTDPHESEYDLFHTGHAGTSISAALGLAVSMAHEKDAPHAISVIGDASLGAGVAFEALSNAGASGQRMLVVLNDNEWSISKSVGALARYLTRIRSARVVQRAQQEIHGLLQSIPLIGTRIEDTIDQVREVLRHTIVQGHVFEELGVTYVGPVDGHDVNYLEDQLRRVRQVDGVVLLHTLTEKGKGHPDAPNHPERVHAAKPAKKKEHLTGKFELTSQPDPEPSVSFTQAFAGSLRNAAERDLRVHVITAGMASGTGLTEFAERFPARFHDVGICEQHGVAMAAGMCKGGLRPVVAIYSTFLQRAYDQVFQEAALQGLPVVFCMDRAGLVGQDGPTHHGVFDIAYLRTLPGFVICAPRDASDMQRMLEMGLRHEAGPVGIRYPRDNCVPHGAELIPVAERAEMLPGKAELLVEGESIMLWVSGALVRQAAVAVERLRRQGVDVGLVDARFIKPLDEELLARHLRSAQHVIVVEEHQRAGGFGSAVLEAGSRVPDAKARIRILGVPDRYIDHMTTRDEQLRAAGIDGQAIEKLCLSIAKGALVQ